MRATVRRSLAVGAVALVGGVGVGGVGVGGVGVGGVASAADARHDVAEVRAATARLHRVGVAENAGYGLLIDADGLACIEDPDGAGAMGTHYVNSDLVGDGLIDAEQPEALLYDQTGRGDRLLGVEYVVFVADWGEDRDPPSLYGQEFERVDEPNRYGLPPFYELHAWVWTYNPAGMFEDWNPRIDC